MPNAYLSFSQVTLLTIVLLAGGLFPNYNRVHAQPIITTVSPPVNSSAAPRAGTVTVSFSQPLLASSASALKIYSSQRGELRTATATVFGATLSYTPGAYSFLPNETLNATVTTAAASSNGSLLKPYVFQFTAAASTAGGGRFIPGTTPTVGTTPLGVATGDVDGDGDIDLVSANYGDGTVSVRLNGGDATSSNTGIFSGGQNVVVGSGTYSVVLADVDGDGDLDLLAANQNSSIVSVRLNGGNAAGSNTGVFSGTQNVAVGSGPNMVVVGDVDGDGDLDMLTANYYDNTVSIRLNGGNNQGTNTGVFAASATASEVSVGFGPTALLLGDVDGDGDLDVMVPNQNNTVSIRLNGGGSAGVNTGVFSGSQEVAVGTNPLGASEGDVDNDGDLDIVTANANANSISVRLNGGDASGSNTGVFSNGSTVAVGLSPSSIALGDIDGDGDLDVLTANRNSNTVSVRLNGGDASGQNRGIFTAPAAANVPEVAVGNRPSYVRLADADGDGDLDLFTANYNSNSLSVRLNQVALAAITSFTPAQGPVGGTITLNGAALQGATAVTFTGSGATMVTTGFTVSSNGAQITGIMVPAGATTGPVSVTLPAGTTTSTVNFTVVPVPTLTSFTPGSGQIGTSVTVNGTNLTGTSAVTFTGTSNNSVTSGFSVNTTGTQITGVAVPIGASTGPLSVTAAGGTATSAASFIVIPVPYIASFTPNSGVAGTAVVMQGANLSGLTGLYLNGVDATASVTGNTGTSLTFTVPAGAPATATTTLSSAAGTGTSTGFTVRLRVQASNPAPNARSAPRAGSAVAVTFSESVTTASAQGLRVYSAQRGGRRAGAVAVSGATANFAASADFAPGELVSVSVPAAVQSAGGVPLERRVFQFTAATAGAGRGVFRPGTVPAVGQSPIAITLGDVDGDGDLDLLTANRISNTVSVRLNGGNATGSNLGNFGNGQNVAVGTNPAALVLGDVDGDGDLDFAVANSGTNTVSIRLNGSDSSGSNTGQYSNGSTVVVGSGPSAVVLYDVDGDGDLDLLATNYYDNTVSVRLNGGDATGTTTGTFSNGSNPVIGSMPKHLAVGDIDGDGDGDLVVASSGSGSVNIRLNGGDATGSSTGVFSGSQNVLVGTTPYCVALADLDADGDLDIVTANKGSASANTRLNGGDATGTNTGQFSGGATLAVGTNPYWAAVGDVDGDGDLDLLVANQGSGTLSLRLNGGNASGGGSGVFAPPANTPEVAAGTAPSCLALGDIDGDGDVDAVATDQTSNTAVVRFNLPPAPVISSFTPTSGPTGISMTLTGTNLNGVTAITFAGSSGNVVTNGYTISGPGGTQIAGIIVPGGAVTGPVGVTSPSGTGSTTGMTPANFTTTSPYVLTFTPNSGVAGTAVVMQGANLSGLTGLYLNGVDATASVTGNTGTSLTFTVPAGAPATATTTLSSAAGTGTSTGFTVRLRVQASNPAPNARSAPRAGSAVAVTFSESVTTASAQGLRVYSAQRGGRRAGAVAVSGATANFAASADFAPGELVSVSVPAAVQSAGGVPLERRVFQFTAATAGAGRGVFRPGSTLGPGYTGAVAGDVDGDGDLDVVAGNSGVRIYRNGRNGAGTNIGTFSTIPDTSIPIAAADIALGDVDGDGDLDIAAAGGTGTMVVSVLLNGGDNTGSNTGVFGPATAVTVGDGPSSIALADVDGDGDLDLLAACSLSSSVNIRLNGGDGSGSNTGVFYNGSGASFGPSTQTVTVGDVDGDGDLDLLATMYRSNNVIVRLNGGDASGTNTGLFSNGSTLTLSGFPNKVELGDVDGDGDLDLLTAISSTNSVHVRLNGSDASGSNTGVFSNGTTVQVGANPQFVRLGDIDADGDLDFVVSNQDANSVSVLLNGGNNSGSGTGIFSAPATLLPVAVGQTPFALSLIDVDNDGDVDLLTGSASGLTIRLNQATPLASTAPTQRADEWVIVPTVTDGSELHYWHSGANWPPATVAIYNLVGQQLGERRPLPRNGAFNIKGLATGWYMARLVTNEGINTSRFYVP